MELTDVLAMEDGGETHLFRVEEVGQEEVQALCGIVLPGDGHHTLVNLLPKNPCTTCFSMLDLVVSPI